MSFTPSRGQFSGRTFPSYRQYRNALAKQHGFPSLSAQQRAPNAIFTGSALDRLSPREQEERKRALRALNLMRDEQMPMSHAAKEAGISTSTARRYIDPALEKRGGRWQPTKQDRLLRRMVFNTDKGQILLDVKDSRTASKVAQYHAAVRNYLRTGDERGLRRFHRKYVQSGKRRYPYITDPNTLARLHEAGELSFEDLYQVTT